MTAVAKTKPAPKKAPRPTPPRPAVPAPEPEAQPPLADYVLPHYNDPTPLAQDLARFLREHNLVVTLGEGEQARTYVLLEGWEFVGAQLGQAGATQWCRDVSTSAGVAYHARAVLIHLATGRRLGAGEAVASNEEAELRQAPAHVLASLAQNRAIMSAFYHSLGWLMQLAGIDATPPEMVYYLPNAPVVTAAPAVAAPAATPVPAAPVAPGRPSLRQAQREYSAQQQAAEDAKTKGAPITDKQREEIQRQLNHPAIKREEKTRVLSVINTYDEGKAKEMIAALQLRIDKHGETPR